MKRIIAPLLALSLLPLAATAQERAMQVVAESVDIRASPADVWNMVKRFGALQEWHPAFPSPPSSRAGTGRSAPCGR